MAATDEDPSDSCCVICLEAITDPCELLPCGHVQFDLVCLCSWLDLHPACPLCKARATRVLHGPRGVPGRRCTEFNQVSVHGIPRWPGWHQSSTAVPALPPPSPPRRRVESSAVIGRRFVYRNGLYALHVGSNPVSQYQELTPDMFRRDPELVVRAQLFIRRELRVFSFLEPLPVLATTTQGNDTPQYHHHQPRHASTAEFLEGYILAMLKSFDVAGSMGAAHDMLGDFLGEGLARQFLHELRAWLRSPFARLEEWDRAVQYPRLLPLSGGSGSGSGGERQSPPGYASSPEQERMERRLRQYGQSSREVGRPAQARPRAASCSPIERNVRRFSEPARWSTRSSPSERGDVGRPRQRDQQSSGSRTPGGRQ